MSRFRAPTAGLGTCPVDKGRFPEALARVVVQQQDDGCEKGGTSSTVNIFWRGHVTVIFFFFNEKLMAHCYQLTMGTK